ncbi:limonene hydroxylase [Paenibacillus thailandensis]|uniref:Limonene hydroxylase n=1 Tax=Paenibacillus thailandensis TaxID=393250 RepID=A0ABW5QZB1_9BACL
MYIKVLKADIAGIIDDVLDVIRNHSDVQWESVFHEAVWLSENGAHRNAVKFGIALLGLFQNEQAKELLLTLGKHEEFTLYAAVAIQNGMKNGNEVLFELAKSVHGWGKIHIVERLEPTSPHMKDWLLRHGCSNTVMNEYLACVCARKGDLKEALSSDRVDKDLFEGATDIVEALLYGGPAEDIDDYEHAPKVLSDYVRLAREMYSTVKHLSVMLDIRDFLNSDEKKWTERMQSGWTERLRGAVLESCQSIISRSGWGSTVMDAVRSSDTLEHYYGVTCSRKLGIDIWEELFAQLVANPALNNYLELMKSDDPNRIRKLVQFAEERLPLRHIASGPADEFGLGIEFEAHARLGSLLQSLDRHEGVGKQLILTGLNSPVVSNRNMALNALEGWNIASWGEELLQAVTRLEEEEPVDSVKERIRKLMEDKGISL